MNRVVVTGMGVVTPVGNDVKTFWDSLISGKCGVDFITKFDASDFKVRIAAEVKDFDPSLYMEKGEIRKTDLYAQYAMAAAVQAMEDSGLDGESGSRASGRVHRLRNRRDADVYGGASQAAAKGRAAHLPVLHPDDDLQYCGGQRRDPVQGKGTVDGYFHGVRPPLPTRSAKRTTPLNSAWLTP